MPAKIVNPSSGGANLSVALIHHPVYDKNAKIVTTSVTNIDVHDIARSCRTYGVESFYIVTPVDAQRALARKIVRHWQDGFGSTYNPNRTDALSVVRLERTLDGAVIDIERRRKELPRIIATSAKPMADSVDFVTLRHRLQTASEPHLLLLGTGWGLTQAVTESADYRLEPIHGPHGDGEYNHLSVRAAAAILLDRLLGIG